MQATLPRVRTRVTTSASPRRERAREACARCSVQQHSTVVMKPSNFFVNAHLIMYRITSESLNESHQIARARAPRGVYSTYTYDLYGGI
jgi:late competence protein required for DNA uptake (superfamily II DNA/RNA helicase)